MERVCRILSAAMLPLLVPFYVTLLLLWGDTVIAFMPLSVKWYYAALVFMITALIPCLSILSMRSLGMIHSVMLEERDGRSLPIASYALCCAICAYIIGSSPLTFLVVRLLWGAAGCSVVALAVNRWWKISIHMTGAGGMVAMLALVDYAGFGNLFWWLCGAIILAGAVGSARLYLGSHTPAQVAAGFLNGLIVTAIAILV